jgi:hypothetical protein
MRSVVDYTKPLQNAARRLLEVMSRFTGTMNIRSVYQSPYLLRLWRRGQCIDQEHALVIFLSSPECLEVHFWPMEMDHTLTSFREFPKRFGFIPIMAIISTP